MKTYHPTKISRKKEEVVEEEVLVEETVTVVEQTIIREVQDNSSSV